MKVVKILAACICAAGVAAQSACSFFGAISYPNAEKYSAGGASFSSQIDKIEIDWLSGKVNIAYRSGDGVSISETSNSALSDDMRVHLWLDGTTLRVKFAASGVKTHLFRNERKELTVALPENFKLSELIVNAASANVTGEKVRTNKISFSTASGDIDLSCEAEEIELNSSSGKITLGQKGKASSARINTSSGGVEANFADCDKAELNSSSGTVKAVADKVGELSAKTSSGSIYCSLKAAMQGNFYSSSGKVTLCFSVGFGLKANVSTSSGKLYSDLALKKSGNNYVYGDGSAEINVKTSSGSVVFKEA